MGVTNSKISEHSPSDINKKFISLLKNSDLACNYLTKYINEEKKNPNFIQNLENFEMTCDNFVILTEKILKKYFKKIKLNNINEIDYKIDSESINKIFYINSDNYTKISKEKLKNVTKIISKYYIFVYFIVKNIFKNTNKDINLKFLNISDYNQDDTIEFNLTGGENIATSIKNFLSNISSKKSDSLEKNDSNSEKSNTLINNDINDENRSSKNSLLNVFTLNSNEQESEKQESEKQEKEEEIEEDLLKNDSQTSKIFSNNSNTLLEKSSSSKTMFETTNYENLSTINSFIVYLESVHNVDKNKNIIDHLSQFFSKSDNLKNELINYDLITYFIYIINDKKNIDSKELFQNNFNKLFLKVDKYFKKLYNKSCIEIELKHFDNLKIKYDIFLYKFEFISNYLINNKDKYKYVFENKKLLENIDTTLKKLKTKLEKKNKKLYNYFDKIILEKEHIDLNKSKLDSETQDNIISEFDKSIVGLQYEDSSDDEKLSNKESKVEIYNSNKIKIHVLNEQLSLTELHEIYIDNVYITLKKITLFLYYLNDIYNKLIIEIKKEVNDIDVQCRDYFLNKKKSMKKLDQPNSDIFEDQEQEDDKEKNQEQEDYQEQEDDQEKDQEQEDEEEPQEDEQELQEDEQEPQEDEQEPQEDEQEPQEDEQESQEDEQESQEDEEELQEDEQEPQEDGEELQEDEQEPQDDEEEPQEEEQKGVKQEEGNTDKFSFLKNIITGNSNSTTRKKTSSQRSNNRTKKI